MDKRRLLLIASALLATDALGGGVLQGRAQYPAWAQIGAAEFPAYHAAMSAGLVRVFIPFFMLAALLSLGVLVWCPPGVSRVLALAAVALNATLIGVTAFVFLPLQAEFDTVKSMEAITDLVRYDVLRTVPGVLLLGTHFAMLAQMGARTPRRMLEAAPTGEARS